METIASALAKNRAEELGYDVWTSFVVPPFITNLDLYESRKPKLIIGGRGCGKTMLLRYLSHQSSFSRSRFTIGGRELHHIGLYWRADTQFANAMQRRGVTPETWSSAFEHFAALLIGLEFLRSLESIANSSFVGFDDESLDQIRFPSASAFDPEMPDTRRDLETTLQRGLHVLESWVSDVRKAPEPKFLPGIRFVRTLIKDLSQHCPLFKEACFFIYIDEYENLVEYQQELVNTWVKSSENPLIFNIAMKRNGFRTRRTVGAESISDIHDFRQHDIEGYLERDFSVLAAEILTLRLDSRSGVQNEASLRLNEPRGLIARKDPEYRRGVVSRAEYLLPGTSEEQIAFEVFADKALLDTLRERIEKALKARMSDLSPDLFMRRQLPKASIIAPALLFRKNLDPELVLRELDKMERGESSRFTDWVHNNFVGCVLQLYVPFSRPCPFYAGFTTFCQMAHGNIRYLLELCYRCLARSEELSVTSPHVQAEAARQASAAFLKEVRSFGSKGNQLYQFVLELGSLFSLAHLRDTQSESEQTHFAIKEGGRALSADDRSFLSEAIKWSVLFESEPTKIKSENDIEYVDYVLNPIYAPYFHISYRKRRKLDMSAEDLHTFIDGDYEQISTVLNRYRQMWAVSALPLPLFAHLEESR